MEKIDFHLDANGGSLLTKLRCAFISFAKKCLYLHYVSTAFFRIDLRVNAEIEFAWAFISD